MVGIYPKGQGRRQQQGGQDYHRGADFHEHSHYDPYDIDDDQIQRLVGDDAHHQRRDFRRYLLSCKQHGEDRRAGYYQQHAGRGDGRVDIGKLQFLVYQTADYQSVDDGDAGRLGGGEYSSVDTAEDYNRHH